MKITPNEAELPKNRFHVQMMHENKFNKYKKQVPKYKIGEKVRVSKQKHKFSRGYGHQFQNEFFYIHDIKRHLPKPLYILKSAEKENEILEGAFYQSEIFPVRVWSH